MDGRIMKPVRRPLVAELKDNFLGNVLQLLNSCSPEVLDLVKQSVLRAGKSLGDLLPSLLDAIVEAIVDKSAEIF
ncbi:hypothetical protein Taro_012235 [Colocasia esculenta]|uniref:Uncharacterized protein n=1 Tax=Colocasia esculenta TaxID=4460 RepID=A0A843UD31_COLES|nr:hypothetical protein [Colocasia esculenta]